MAARSKSGKLALERLLLVTTRRQPLPTVDPGAVTAREPSVKAPLPLSEYLEYTAGDPPPDRGVTGPWPRG